MSVKITGAQNRIQVALEDKHVDKMISLVNDLDTNFLDVLLDKVEVFEEEGPIYELTVLSDGFGVHFVFEDHDELIYHEKMSIYGTTEDGATSPENTTYFTLEYNLFDPELFRTELSKCNFYKSHYNHSQISDLIIELVDYGYYLYEASKVKCANKGDLLPVILKLREMALC